MSVHRHLLLTADAVGGVWQYSLELATALAPLGYRVTLAVLGPAPDAKQRAAAAAVPGLEIVEAGLALDWVAEDAGSVTSTEIRLAELAGDMNTDLVQRHTPALVSRGAYPCPVVTVMHSCVASWWRTVKGGALPVDFSWRAALATEGLRRSALVVAPSAAFGREVTFIYGVRPVTVHNGRDFTIQPFAMQDYAFTAGRLWDEGKNLRTLDAAAKRIGVPFKAAGSLKSPHGEAISLHHLHALGSLDADAMARHLGSRPVFASSALYEPFGLAALEAASAGCALILSDIPTFHELWEGAAMFVDPHDADGFARAIEDMVEDIPVRVAAGQRAADRACAYTRARMGAQMAGLYAQIRQRDAA